MIPPEKITKIIFILLALTACFSCKKDEEENCPDPNAHVRQDSAFVTELRNKSRESDTLGGVAYYPAAYCWRDMMPPVNHDGGCSDAGFMISLVWLNNFLDTSYDEGISIVRQFVIKGDTIWAPPFRENAVFENEKISNFGPRWDIGSRLDVILEIEYQGTRYFLIEEDVILQGPQ